MWINEASSNNSAQESWAELNEYYRRRVIFVPFSLINIEKKRISKLIQDQTPGLFIKNSLRSSFVFFLFFFLRSSFELLYFLQYYPEFPLVRLRCIFIALRREFISQLSVSLHCLCFVSPPPDPQKSSLSCQLQVE